jgi:hypothetical protein
VFRSIFPTAPSRVRILLAAAVALTACGCGGGNVPVKGKATADDKPLPAGSVLFYPDKEKGNTATGEPQGIITEGNYEMTTNGKPGVPPGWYKVVVNAAESNTPSSSATPPTGKPLIASKYNKLETTDLRIEVKAGAADGAYDLKLSGPGVK